MKLNQYLLIILLLTPFLAWSQRKPFEASIGVGSYFQPKPNHLGWQFSNRIGYWANDHLGGEIGWSFARQTYLPDDIGYDPKMANVFAQNLSMYYLGVAFAPFQSSNQIDWTIAGGVATSFGSELYLSEFHPQNPDSNQNKGVYATKNKDRVGVQFRTELGYYVTPRWKIGAETQIYYWEGKDYSMLFAAKGTYSFAITKEALGINRYPNIQEWGLHSAFGPSNVRKLANQSGLGYSNGIFARFTFGNKGIIHSEIAHTHLESVANDVLIVLPYGLIREDIHMVTNHLDFSFLIKRNFGKRWNFGAGPALSILLSEKSVWTELDTEGELNGISKAQFGLPISLGFRLNELFEIEIRHTHFLYSIDQKNEALQRFTQMGVNFFIP